MPTLATASNSSRPRTTRRSSPRSSRTRSGSRKNRDLSPAVARALRAALRRWWLAHRRDLPWRRTRDPYAIWISEVMLQQTTVAVGRIRLPDFLARFPTVASLAAASEDEVLAAWSGLGYYARARNLRRAAQKIAARGSFPRTAAELARLPGIGPYTAAAVASIAFGEPVAAVDANAARVVARFSGIDGDVRAPRVAARVAAAAQLHLDRERPGDHNQALMDLGASVCTPRDPRCAACPLARRCLAQACGAPERYGAAPRRVATRGIVLAAGVALRGGRLVLVPDTTLVRGHLSVPLCEAGEDPASALLACWPARASAVEPLGTLRHSVLNRRYTVHVFRVNERPRASRRGVVLASPEEIARLPHGGLLRKLLHLVDWGP